MNETTLQSLSKPLQADIPVEIEAEDSVRAQYREIAQLAGGLAHEIRNPLSTMRLNLDLVVEELSEADDSRDRRVLVKIERVQRESRRLESLVEDFLRLVRAVEPRPSLADLNAIVDDLCDFCEPQASPRGVVVRTNYDQSIPHINLDVDMFKQALFNLVSNALHAMPDGGELMIETHREGQWAVLEVTDTGHGIPLDLQQRIFQPFFSTRPGGSGLGLSMTKRVVSAHRGRIEVESEPGKGSRFRLFLPLETADATRMSESGFAALQAETPQGREP